MVGTRSMDSERRIIQMLPRFIRLGTSVLPAPTKTPYATMLAAYSGSAHASMRRMDVPRLMTSASVVMSPIISGAKTAMRMPMTVKMPMPSPTDIHAKLRIRSWRFAPWLCHTSVVAASAMPKPGM